jgi:hypothetical protein
MDALPERRLMGAILDSALSDAKMLTGEGIRAAEFLLGPRSDPYFHLLGFDPVEYRLGLWKFANAHVSSELGTDAKARRALRINLEEAMKRYGHQL